VIPAGAWPRPRPSLAALALVLAALSASTAAAENTKLRLDRAVAEPSWLPGRTRLQLYATAITLQGAFVPVVGQPGFTLQLGASKKRVPYLLGQYEALEEPLAVALVVMTAFDYADDFPEIRRELTRFVETLPKSAEVSVISYADSVHSTTLASPGRALKKLDGLAVEAAPGQNVLIKAVEKAIRVLDRAKLEPPHTSARKIIVVVSDGKDVDPEPTRYRKAGELAARKRIRIHAIAFSPEDNRRPLLGLGELSKRSHGTFRWVRQPGLFSGQIGPLDAEIGDQYVLTFFLDQDIDKKRVSLLLGDIASNDLKVEVGCGEEECSESQYCLEGRCVTRQRAEGAGILGWLLYLIGGGFALLLVLAAVGYLLQRRARGVPVPAPVAANAPPAAPVSAHRIAAVDAHGNPVGPAAGAGPALPPSPGHAAAPRSAAHPAALAPAPAAAPVLYVVKGPGAGTSLPIIHGFTIGSQPGLHLSLVGDTYASSIHAQILMDTAGNCTIVDKGSTNGTFVNGVRTQQMQLRHGMAIQVGGAELRFLLP
jgi:hypothetical protein